MSKKILRNKILSYRKNNYKVVSLKYYLLKDILKKFNLLKNKNIGGYFPPHRDHPSIPRNCFRIIVFLQNCGPQQYDWFMEDDKKLMIEHGRAYYVNTRMTHRTISWVDKSDHMIMNIPMTTENVEKVIANLLHTH